MDLLRTYIRTLLESREDKVTAWARQFKTADEFVAAIRAGHGFKKVVHVYAHIDRNTDGRLASGVKSKLAAESEWWTLTDVPVSRLELTHVDTMRDEAGDVDVTVPIVVDAKMQVLDGRHRTELAKERGLSTMQAWVPAEVFYRLTIGDRFR